LSSRLFTPESVATAPTSLSRRVLVRRTQNYDEGCMILIGVADAVPLIAAAFPLLPLQAGHDDAITAATCSIRRGTAAYTDVSFLACPNISAGRAACRSIPAGGSDAAHAVSSAVQVAPRPSARRKSNEHVRTKFFLGQFCRCAGPVGRWPFALGTSPVSTSYQRSAHVRGDGTCLAR
jgi:hypothetical protein